MSNILVPVFISSPTFCGMPYQAMLRAAKRLGFDGVEVLLTEHAIESRRRLLMLARECALGITFHRWWHGPESSSYWLTKIGKFPPYGIRLRHRLGHNFRAPVVVSTYNWGERGDVKNAIIQLAPGGDAPNQMNFDDMMDAILTERSRIVFDVMHILQYKFGETDMPEDPKQLLEAAHNIFYLLREQVVEVHAYDFRPNAVSGSGCNLFPGYGKFPIYEFIQAVAKRGWRGRIVWEIHPFVILKNLWRPWWITRQLRQLPLMTRKVFAA